jgi:quercetin dioxygenase-like cupin family protein
MSETLFTRWSDVPLEPMNPLLGRQFVSSATMTVGRITLAKGAHVPVHTHPNEQAVCILSGSLRFVLYEPGAGSESVAREVVVTPGKILIIAADIPHEAFALEDTIDLDIFAPPRQDWISGDDAYLRSTSQNE